jgi:hypothetical protein
LIPQVVAEWLKIGTDTAPVDRAKVREILGRLYALAHKRSPKQVIHLESPFQIAKVISQLFLAGRPVSTQVCRRVSRQVCQQFAEPLRKQFRGQAIGQVPAPELNLGEDLVHEQINAHIRGVRLWPIRPILGQFSDWLSWFDFADRLGIDVSKLAPSFDLAKACGWSVLFWEWAFISARPEWIHRDAMGRLHCETGAAIRYPDGFSIFAIHGVRVPAKVAVAPISITIPEIECEENAELRRVMIERYGPERYLMDSHAAEIHRDDFGILYRKATRLDEPLVMVKVVNATPEPDGNFKDYFLRVPPTLVRARQAVAWTFGKSETDYAPALQT